MRLHERFEWDPAKAAGNIRDHGVSFEQAMEVLGDRYGDHFHRLRAQEIDGEDRWVTTAADPYRRDRIYVIVWTERLDIQGVLTRIISARRACAQERNDYEEEIYR